MAPQTVRTLRRAFDAMLDDLLFREEIQRAGIQLKPMPGEQLQDVVAKVAGFPPALVQKARSAREKP